MEEPGVNEHETSPGEQLLRRVAQRAGIAAEPDVALALGEWLDAQPDDEPWHEALQFACEQLGLVARASSGTLATAAHLAGPGRPVVLRASSGEHVLLSGGRDSTAEASFPPDDESSSIRIGDLLARLAPPHLGSVEWVAINPLETEVTPSAGDVGPAAPSPWRRLQTLLFRERTDVVVVIAFAVGVGFLNLATPIAVQALVNTVAFGVLLQPLAFLAMLLLAALAIAGVLRALQAWVVELIQRRLFLRLVDDLSFRLPRVDLGAFDRAHGPELVNRFFDVFAIQKAAASLLLGGLELALAAGVGMLVLAFYHPFLLAFDVLLLAVVAAILFGLGRGATSSAVKESKAKYAVASWLEEVARHPAAFKLAGGPSLARVRADELAATYLGYREKHFRVVFRQLSGALALQVFASAGILGIGGWLVITRQLTLGQLVAAELIVTMVVASFARVGKHLETTYDLLAALDKVGQLVDLPLEPALPGAVRPRDPASPAALEASDLTFGYREAAPIGAGLDLQIRPGERVVLTGGSGSGRSALVDVLLGLRRPHRGRVALDGVVLEELDHELLRRRAALVRGTEVIVGTLLENVTFGRRDLDVNRVREVLSRVALLDEVSALPEGLATRVLPDGSPLSRGQARRLVLARAIAADPSLLVIDGALDGLDAETRERVLDTVFDERAPWTLLVVTSDPLVEARCRRTLELLDGGLREIAHG